VHRLYALAFLALVLLFRWLDDPSMIQLILKLAGYTYGPLLGLFLFALLAQARRLRPAGVLPVALLAPLACGVIDAHQAALLGSYRIGLEMLLLNALFTLGGLWLVSRKAS
jgi:hypothetical protein